MNYEEALAYIQNIQSKLGSEYSLEAVTELSCRVGRPDKALKMIHVAGTNGKGSVGTYLANILQQSGYTVGRYLSPTIIDYRERIQRLEAKEVKEKKSIQKMADGFATKEEIAETLTVLKYHCGDMVKEGFCHPTAFEMETVMALLLFQKWEVDFAIVECGLGGRLDATNFIAKPLLCLFTSISKDHMGILGDTIEDIAKEKYGIIKEKTLVVSQKQEFSKSILEDICRKKDAKLYWMDVSEITDKQFVLDHNAFCYQKENYELGQNGVYQMENAALAITAANVLLIHGYEKITTKRIKKALQTSYWYGRFEVLSKNPCLIVDGAHNEDGAKRLKESLETYFPDEKFLFIMGMYQDKEYQKVLQTMLPLAKKMYMVSTKGIRSLSAQKLSKLAKEYLLSQDKTESKDSYPIQTTVKYALQSNDIIDCESVAQAIEFAVRESDNADTKTIIFGTLSFINEIYEHLSFL